MVDHQSEFASSDGSDPDAEHFAEFASGIYRRASADTVASALRYAVRGELFAKNPTIMLMFVRVAEVYADARQRLQDICHNATGPERQALELVLNPPNDIRDAKYLPDEVGSPGEMDLCWAEFLVTGNTDAVEKIVSVLDRVDRTRQFLAEQLQGGLDLSEAELMELQKYGIGIGKRADDQDWQVMTPGDTDIFLWLGARDNEPGCLRLMHAMDESLQLHLANKGAALMSLYSNAAQHGKIRLLCEQAAKQAGGPGRELLNPTY